MGLVRRLMPVLLPSPPNGCYQRSDDNIYIGAANYSNGGDTAILVLYSTPGEAAIRQEVGVRGGTAFWVGDIGGEHVVVTILPLGGGSSTIFTEHTLEVSVGPDAPIAGGATAGVQYSVTSQGEMAVDPFIQGKAGPVGVTVQPGLVKVGPSPDSGPVYYIGLQGKLGEGQLFLTTNGYFGEMGADTFGKLHAPGMQFSGIVAVAPGQQTPQGWEGGLDVLRRTTGNVWGLNYREVP